MKYEINVAHMHYSYIMQTKQQGYKYVQEHIMHTHTHNSTICSTLTQHMCNVDCTHIHSIVALNINRMCSFKVYSQQVGISQVALSFADLV